MLRTPLVICATRNKPHPCPVSRSARRSVMVVKGRKFSGGARGAIALLSLGFATLLPNLAYGGSTEDVASAMQALKAKAAAFGPAQIRGSDPVGGRDAPALFFGTTKINNNFTVVDEVQKANGGVATFFVRSGDGFIRVATNVIKDDGTRAIGTVLDPKGKVIEAVRKDASFYGDADILGKSYATGYEPIHDAAGKVIGIYFVGYAKAAPEK